MATQRKGRYQIYVGGLNGDKSSDFWWWDCVEGMATNNGWFHFKLPDGAFGAVGPGEWREVQRA